MKKRVISLILALALIIGCMPTVFAVGADRAGSVSGSGGPLSLTANSGKTGNSLTNSVTTQELTKYESYGLLPFSESDAARTYAFDDIVTFIVVTENKPLLASYSVSDIAAQTASVQRHLQKQTATVESVKADVTEAFGEEDGFEMGYTYTIATTGFSVTTAYGNKAEIEAMTGVKSVYVAPTFSLPEDGMEQELSTFTNNASTMIGADVLNSSGYTGMGQRIAILDTGIYEDHPNFQALPEEALEDPMTQESVNEIWKTLNASQMTNYLNLSYESTKIPFKFNYVSGDFNVSNSYAGSDHGTHVAGIAAANKVEGSNVVGVAPDAQLVVMQVFQQGGGASWDTIMAALEDCVRLEVDCANLSLGAAAGFTDPAGDMLETLDLFLDSDIQLLIASGNDTNNAYGNAWGLNMSLITDPDIGLAGTPSTYSAALGVASVDNDGYDQLYITVGGQDFGYQDTAATAATSFIGNFQNAELEYVVVPGVGEEADYEGLDVTGKVALISRGTTSFPEKQALAQEKGAIACVIYNNAMGIFAMQINDGEGHIPAISVSRAAGAWLIEQAGEDGTGTLKVCNADVKTFKIDRTVSSFSSWGVTPDLKLKPEIAGVGGSIYSTVDPELSGSYYGYMSGTSMATPQITGAMAVLIDYLEENYPDLTGAQQRQVAANLLMSTAEPIMAADALEYSPRAQGAGLANLVNATTSGAYLSNPAASEGRPKAEFGDDDEKSGVYTFTFTITNMTGADKTYTFDSSLLTESIYAGYFIANAPYGLEARVETAEQVTVPANSTVTVDATLTLTENDKAYLEQFPNGIYVEGYLYAIPETGAEAEQAVTLTMPIVGFYGDWSAADIFDSEDPEAYSLYPTLVYTYYSQLGTNPYFRSGRSGDEYNAFSYSNPLYEIDFGMLRNAKYLNVTVTDTVTGEVYHTLEGYDVAKSYYSSTYGTVIPAYLQAPYGEVWDGLDADGNNLPDGTTVTYKFEAWLDDGDTVMDDSWSFNVTLDNKAPEILNEDALDAAVRTENGRTYLTLELQDNQYLAAVFFMSDSGDIMGKFEPNAAAGEAFTAEYDITGFGKEFSIIAADYACNETEVEVYLSGLNDAGSEPTELSKDRLYGNETFDGALVEGGWFSANKADFSDPRNETYDSSNRYYSAEYINGYLIAQNATTGNLELVTPSGSYWSTKELVTQQGKVGEDGVWVLYDMALDHSASEAYEGATDRLYAVGWYYRGDNDGDNKDDGYNALFEVVLGQWGNYVQPVAAIGGTEGELLTLGITTDGTFYGIDTAGHLYTFDPDNTYYDDSIGTYGEWAVSCSYIGTTDFVNVAGYSGCNVIQSMGYDHNTGTMYWYAHSQTLVGYSYTNTNITYTVDLETGKCTEVGTYGPGGQTCLFVPNDLESNLFTMGVEPSGFEFAAYEMYMVEGQTNRLKVNWKPWNAAAAQLTWASADETVATVDENGFIQALKEGTTTITASATVLIPADWGYDENWNWVYIEAHEETVTNTCNLTVLPSEDALYSYIIADYKSWTAVNEWYTYADKTPEDITFIGEQVQTYVDPATGETVEVKKPTWQGGTYYNGYVYTTTVIPVDDGTGAIGTASALYRSKVTEGATPAETVIGEPELVGTAMGVEISALGFDYNTGRMYCIEDKYLGGLGIIDLDTGAVDILGTYTGDLAANSWVCAMCVTADGTIVVADAYDSLFTVNPDTLETRQIHRGEGVGSMFWAAMTYNYDTGYIYWNPCQDSMASPLYLVMLPESEWGSATVVDLGDVSSKYGVQQTVIFTIPENEPETNHVDTESIEIANGDSVIGLEGGTLQLNPVTVPARPTVQAKTWTSSDESIVTVDSYGLLTYTGVGTATVTVSISNKDGSTFTDSIQVTVLESAGEFQAFLAEDMNGSYYYDFWLTGNDYDIAHTEASKSMISVYSLRSGTYYDGYYYGYTGSGEFLRIDADDPSDYRILGKLNLDTSVYQVTAMAMDYTTSTMYGLTLSADYDFNTWTGTTQYGSLVTIDLTTGAVTEVAQLDFSAPVFALACDASGQLYAAGGTFDYYAQSTTVYKLDKATAAQTPYLTIDGACVYTGPAYYGTAQYNAQMTYDFGTDRLYLNATSDHQYYSASYGVYMIQLGDEPTYASLGEMKLNFSGSQNKDNDMFLSLFAFIPEADEVPVGPVSSISLNKSACRIPVGDSTQLSAQVSPSNAADTSVTWTSEDPAVATVDENGKVTGVSEGVVRIIATSNENGQVTAVCTVTVVSLSGPHSTAYTVSARKDALYSFNPELPGLTAEKVVTLSGGANIRGLAYGDNCLYYAIEENGSTFCSLYRFDLTTYQSTYLGQIYTWVQINDIAYDADTGLLYATAGFYLFQFDVASLSTESLNYYTNSPYLYDSNTWSTYNSAGVEVIDGEIYVFANEYSYGTPTLLKYSNMYLNDLSVVATDLDINLVQGAADVAYDARTEKFYLTDAGHNIYAMDLSGNVEFIDVLGDGIDMYGLTIDPTARYTVTYTDGIEGEALFADQTYNPAENSATPAFAGTPERTGYTFAGWSPAVAETVTESVTYTATWTANTYTITLLAGEGSGVEMDVTYGQSVGPLPVPARDGYTFLGWFDAEGNEYTYETVYTVAGDTTLTAAWAANEYTLTLDAAGGTVDPAAVTVTYDAAVGQLPVPVKAGYTFIGWLDAEGNKVLAETVYTVAGDSTLTAQWSANAYTVTLNPGEGAAVDPADVNVVYGEVVNTLPVPTREGYTFAGWFDAEGNEYTAETVYAVVGDVTLTAAWTANTYTITLDDGTEIPVTYGEAVGELPVPTMDGYTFAGWFDAEGNEYTAETVYAVAGDTALTAAWTANTYTVTLDDGNGNKTTLEVTYGEPIGELPVPTRDGYKFVGWLDGDGNTVTAETAYTWTDDVTLTASWAKVDSSNAQTGDETPVVMLIGLLLLSAGCLYVLVQADRKNRRTNQR